MAQTSAVCHSKNLDRPTHFWNEELINKLIYWYIVTTLGQVSKVDKIVNLARLLICKIEFEFENRIGLCKCLRL